MSDEKQAELFEPQNDKPAELDNEPVIEVQIAEDGEAVVQNLNQEKEDEPDEVQKALKKLKKKLEKEKRARQEAEERARLASQKLNSAYGEVDDTNIQLVNGAIDTVKRENEYLKSEYKTALAQADFDRAAEIQETMSLNAAKLLQLENGKQSMQTKPRQQTFDANDPVEQFASQLTPRSAAWIRKNPQCVTDARLQQKMIAAHNLAVADGYAPDSDDYFDFIEDTLRLNKKKDRKEERRQDENPMSSASKPMQRQAPPPAAPANRGSTRPDIVRLSRAEVETAKMLGMTEKEYANNKMSLVREGKLPN